MWEGAGTIELADQWQLCGGKWNPKVIEDCNVVRVPFRITRPPAARERNGRSSHVPSDGEHHLSVWSDRFSSAAGKVPTLPSCGTIGDVSLWILLAPRLQERECHISPAGPYSPLPQLCRRS